jgi:carbon starvation protein
MRIGDSGQQPLEAAPRHRHVPVWITSSLAVAGWGLILWWGIADKEGGTKALLKMFGTANQLLAVIALTLATVVMLKRHRRYVWVTALPLLAVGATTFTAAWQTIFSPDQRVGALATARAASAAPAAVQNAWLTTFLTGVLMLFVVSILAISVREAFGLFSRRPDIRLQPTEGT